MKTIFRKKHVICLVGGLLLPLAASANLVADGNFLPPPDGTPTFVDIGAGSTIGGPGAWTVTSGSVDVINGYWQAPPGGGQSIDMQGVASGTLSQTIGGLVVGQRYSLSFEMSGNPDGLPNLKTLAASLGGTTRDFTYLRTGNETDMDWVLKSTVFTAVTTSELLQFSDLSGPPGYFGSVIGNVSLVAVPEASTIFAGALLLLPLSACTLRVLRRCPSSQF